MLHLGHE
jgi:hypothetical protein